MRVLEANVPASRILESFRNDQKVVALDEPWPETQKEQEALLLRAERPVGNVLALNWALCELDRDEFLDHVRPVWVPPGRQLYSWTMRQMCDAWERGEFTPTEKNGVPGLVASMRKKFREEDFVLVGYHVGGVLRLEEGHNRATAARLAGVLPATIKMYLGSQK